jgi:hypothetical protein
MEFAEVSRDGIGKIRYGIRSGLSPRIGGIDGIDPEKKEVGFGSIWD